MRPRGERPEVDGPTSEVGRSTALRVVQRRVGWGTSVWKHAGISVVWPLFEEAAMVDLNSISSHRKITVDLITGALEPLNRDVFGSCLDIHPHPQYPDVGVVVDLMHDVDANRLGVPLGDEGMWVYWIRPSRRKVDFDFPLPIGMFWVHWMWSEAENELARALNGRVSSIDMLDGRRPWAPKQHRCTFQEFLAERAQFSRRHIGSIIASESDSLLHCGPLSLLRECFTWIKVER